MESSPTRPPDGGHNGQRGPAREFRDQARNALIQSRLTPNAISMVGLVGNLIAAALVLQEMFFLAGIAFILGSVMDTLDGRDRIEEGIVLTAVAYYFAEQGDSLAAAACVYVVLGSLMVSYTRARAEALGVECKVGLATRPVRVVLLSIGLLFAKGAGLGDFELLAPAVYVMAVLTTVTVFQRVWHVRGELAKEA